jgi:hypothetical protein
MKADEIGICDICGKEKPINQLRLMKEGVGIPKSNDSKIIEYRVNKWAKIRSLKSISGFPEVCTECQKEKGFQDIIKNYI